MIKVAVFKNGFTAIGHADYAEYGKDIVCSAVSSLTQTTAMGLERFCNAVSDVYEGNMSVHIAQPNIISEVLLYSMYMGLKEIEKEYSNHIQVKEDFE